MVAPTNPEQAARDALIELTTALGAVLESKEYNNAQRMAVLSGLLSAMQGDIVATLEQAPGVNPHLLAGEHLRKNLLDDMRSEYVGLTVMIERNSW